MIFWIHFSQNLLFHHHISNFIIIYIVWRWSTGRDDGHSFRIWSWYCFGYVNSGYCKASGIYLILEILLYNSFLFYLYIFSECYELLLLVFFFLVSILDLRII